VSQPIPDVLKAKMEEKGVKLSPEHPGWIEWRCRGCGKIWYIAADSAYPSRLRCNCGSYAFERV